MNTIDKINQDFLTRYSTVFTDKLFQRVYENKSHLTGKDILSLTSIKQLNLFVIKAFFTEWQEEVKKLQSPLFDYKAQEVRRSMVEFMNVLSQHISIAQQDLKPYVEKALFETVLLAYDPQSYLVEELQGKKSSRFTARFIKSNLKYIDIHKELLLDFFTSMEGETVREALAKSELYFEDQETTREVGLLLSALSEYLIVTREELFTPTFHSPSSKTEEEAPVPEGQETDVEVQAEELTASSSDYFGRQVQSGPEARQTETGEPATAGPAESGSVEEHALESEQEAPEAALSAQMEMAEDVPEVGEEEVSGEGQEEDSQAEEQSEEETIPDSQEEANVNQQFEEDHKTLAEIHEEKKIESVFEAISINHRYMFLQELFDGDNETFNRALKDVDACGSFDEAVEMLVQNYAKEYFWDMNSEEVKELLKVIYRRFR